MLAAEAVLAALQRQGCGPYLGVPCSFLTPLINAAISAPDQRYLAANNEGEAVAMAAGAYLAGARPVVMFQNSGLGNAVSPLTSLTHTFRIPLLLITTQRGQPGLDDEPQHALMGSITDSLLETMGVAHAVFPAERDDLAAAVAAACAHMAAEALPYAFILRHGTLADHALTPPPHPEPRVGALLPGPDGAEPPAMTRLAAIEAAAGAAPADAALIATTGKIGRELFTCAERPGNLYVVGSMGCAASIGLGVALEQPRRAVLVLDGDGAALMRMEALASIGHYRPERLVHVILDNRMHESTGGQASLAATVDFPRVAAACGYATAERVVTAAALARATRRALAQPGPHLIHARVLPGSAPGLGRPTLAPVDVKARFMTFLAG